MRTRLLTAIVAAVVIVSGAPAHAHAQRDARESTVSNIKPPGVSGEAVFGHVLRAGPGRWEPADVALTYRWLRDGAFVPGERERIYALDAGDIGHRMSVEVTATAEDQSKARAISEPTARVKRARFVARQEPQVEGVLRYTHTVLARTARLNPTPSRVRYQWLRSGQPIVGATRQRYTFAPTDVGRRIRVRVTSYAAGYRPLVSTSGPQARVRHRVDVRRRVTYSVATRGHITANLKQFRRQAQQTYDDPRGWRAKGVEFRPVARGGSFTLVLAAASSVPSFSSQCSAEYSCRVGRFVIINQTRWLHASPPWNAAGESLRDYRHLVVNHETGHWLGKGHAGCPRPGALAPVMAQQSKGTGGCRFNPWPTAAELR